MKSPSPDDRPPPAGPDPDRVRPLLGEPRNVARSAGHGLLDDVERRPGVPASPHARVLRRLFRLVPRPRSPAMTRHDARPRHPRPDAGGPRPGPGCTNGSMSASTSGGARRFFRPTFWPPGWLWCGAATATARTCSRWKPSLTTPAANGNRRSDSSRDSVQFET